MWRKHKTCLDNKLSVRQSPIPPKNISPSAKPNDIIADVMLQVLPIYRHGNYHTQLSTGKDLLTLNFEWSLYSSCVKITERKCSFWCICLPAGLPKGGERSILQRKMGAPSKTGCQFISRGNVVLFQLRPQSRTDCSGDVYNWTSI